MLKERYTHIDVAKGIGILLVVLGHLVPFGCYLSNIIYSFHMPLFYVFSGTFADTKRQGVAYFKHKFVKLILPYLAFVNIGLVVCSVLYFNSNLPIEVIYHDLLSGHPDCFLVGATWFLVSLFIVNIIFYFVNKFVFSKEGTFFKVLSILICLAFVLVGKFIRLRVFSCLKIGTAIMGFSFYCLGFFLNKYFKTPKIYLAEKIIIIPAVVLILFAPKLNSTVGFVNCDYGNLFFFILFALCGTFIVFFISKLLYKIKFLQTFGRNSLLVLGLHNVFFIYPYGKILSKIFNCDLIPQKNLSAIQIVVGMCVCYFNRIFAIEILRTYKRKDQINIIFRR